MVCGFRATCLIDFGIPVDRDDDDSELANSHESALKKLQKSPINRRLKRKLKHTSRQNFEFCAFRDPILFVGHLSKNSILIIDKPWMQVVETLDAPPVHRHIYGT